jgi:hypothetical protein
MARVAIDGTGSLLVDGEKLFPLGLSNGPPPGSKTPAGRDGLDEVAANGINALRTGLGNWELEFADGQIADQRKLHAAAAQHGLHCWLWLGDVPNLPAQAGPREQLLTRIVEAFRNDPALLAWKGVDEPRNPARGAAWIRPDGLVRAHQRIKALDPNHPVVIIQAPLGPASDLVPYRPALDVTGIDIYPVSYPPGAHAGGPPRGVELVGLMARKARQAAGSKPFWMVLQVAWSGVVPTKTKPDLVPRFPSLLQERFMAYQAIVNGARGLFFFGGHLPGVMTPDDAKSGWNWTFWRRVLRPVVSELASPDVSPALVAPAGPAVKSGTSGIEVVTRRTGRFVYVIAVRTGGSVSRVAFTGLPASVRSGEVVAEYVQEPLPPGPGKQVYRTVSVTGGRFTDWFAAYDAHVYRFAV